MRRYLILASCFLLTVILSAQEVISPCDRFDPSDQDALYYMGLGDVLSRQGRFADAQIAYDCSIERDPSFAEAYLSRGVAYASQQNPDAALDDYNRALELNPDMIAAYNNRGLLYTQQINFSLALADFNIALSLDAEYLPAYVNRAMVYAAEGNYDLAMADLDQAIALNADYAPAHEAKGAVYLALAVESYTTAEALNDRPAQFDSADTLQGVLDAAQASDLGIWFRLQEVDQVFEEAS